ncbi:hypothetical protein GQX74_010630 [Glossina fuscipes]|nr:hypothetical protein GQX74_010630 [Glossina fuscipes]
MNKHLCGQSLTKSLFSENGQMNEKVNLLDVGLDGQSVKRAVLNEKTITRIDDYLNRSLEGHILLVATHHYGLLQNIYIISKRLEIKMRLSSSMQEPPAPHYYNTTYPKHNICEYTVNISYHKIL